MVNSDDEGGSSYNFGHVLARLSHGAHRVNKKSTRTSTSPSAIERVAGCERTADLINRIDSRSWRYRYQLNSSIQFISYVVDTPGTDSLLLVSMPRATKRSRSTAAAAAGFCFLTMTQHVCAFAPHSLGGACTTSSCFVPSSCSAPLLSLGKCNAYASCKPIVKQRARRTSSTGLSMALIPIPASTLSTLLVTGLPTSAQYAAYWGRTSRERYQSVAESLNVSFLGVFMAYFVSYILGDFVGILGAFVSAFWILLSPELKAYQRNWELRGGRDLVDPWLDDEVDFGGLREDQRGLYGAYYFGHVVRVAVVEDPTCPRAKNILWKNLTTTPWKRTRTKSSWVSRGSCGCW